MNKKEKIVYFVTLLIKYTKTTTIKGTTLPSKTQSVTCFQKICKKAKNVSDAYNMAIIECQKKYQYLSIISNTVTELTPAIFEDDPNEVETKIEDNTGKVYDVNSDEFVKKEGGLK